MSMFRFYIFILFFAFGSLAGDLLNVSYDPTREFYKEYNQVFVSHWAKEGNGKIRIDQSHGGSGKQARAVIDGLNADVVTLALGRDIDAIASHSGLIPADWEKQFPNHSTPYYSTIVFLVRKGNPKGIQDWGDLVKQGVKVITPNPKTSGGACWNYLAAYEWARQNRGGEEGAKQYLKELFKHVPVLDSGARGATLTFTRRNMGDVLLAWENEAFLAIKESKSKGFEIVYPSLSILAEPSVAIVTKNAERNKHVELATEYLNYLYSQEGQTIAAKHFYRPCKPESVPKEYLIFKELKLVNIREAFGGWEKAYSTHFADGAIYDQICR